jgi:hypothetical protein
MYQEVSNGEKRDENPSSGSRIVSCQEKDGQTKMTEATVANGPKKRQLKKSLISL